MSALARYFYAAGMQVAGYDRTRTALTDRLSAEGMEVTHDPGAIPDSFRNPTRRDQTLVVFTPAVPASHEGLAWFRSQGYRVAKRSEVLGALTRDAYTVAVAGTHGKTTTSTMAAHLATSCGLACTAFLGGISRKHGTNLVMTEGRSGDRRLMIVEADEFDQSFLTLHPDISVITSMDADHLDVYGEAANLEKAYRAFASQTLETGVLLYRKDLPLHGAAPARFTYSISDAADFEARHITVKEGRYRFELLRSGENIGSFTCGLPGRHNIENAVAALAIGIMLGLDPGMMSEALASFEGIQRRFEYRLRTPAVTYIDDYAHHPAELKACIGSVRELYPGKRITGVFQPHLFSRTRDFATAFADSLSGLDELILLDIYPAREEPIPGVTSRMIYDLVDGPSRTMCTRDDLVEKVQAADPEVLLTMGAGDIDQLTGPLSEMLAQKHQL